MHRGDGRASQLEGPEGLTRRFRVTKANRHYEGLVFAEGSQHHFPSLRPSVEPLVAFVLPSLHKPNWHQRRRVGTRPFILLPLFSFDRFSFHSFLRSLAISPYVDEQHRGVGAGGRKGRRRVGEDRSMGQRGAIGGRSRTGRDGLPEPGCEPFRAWL